MAPPPESSTVEEVRTGYLHKGKQPGRELSSGGEISDPVAVRILLTNQPYLLLGANPERKRAWIENRGAGTVWLHKGNGGIDQLKGIRVLANQTFVDDPPFVHTGDWFAFSDVANTDVVVVEWV